MILLKCQLLTLKNLHSTYNQAFMDVVVDNDANVFAAMEIQHSRVVFVHNDVLMMMLSSQIPRIQNRAKIVYNLIKAYNLLSYMRVIDVIPATREDLCRFHSPLYINFLEMASKTYSSVPMEDSMPEEFLKECEEYGIGYDCPIIDDIYALVSLIAGSSIGAAKELCKGTADIAINWYGGWHHAQRDCAEGFCYVNDIVLAIEELRGTFDRILYIDLDIHHGNGVENAYIFSRKVFTVSFHKYEVGFYPGTGKLEDSGVGRGIYHTVNVPLKEGISDSAYCYMFKRIMDRIVVSYKPSAIVLQCGCDSLTGDNLGDFNLTLASFGYCLKQILSLRKPLLLLGGGGYNKVNVARCWTYLTSLAIEKPISNNIPENEYFMKFGPDFVLQVSPSNRKDYNLREYLENIIEKILGISPSILLRYYDCIENMKVKLSFAIYRLYQKHKLRMMNTQTKSNT